MKKTKLLVIILSVVMLMSVCVIPTSANDSEGSIKWYCDLDPDAWYYDDVNLALNYELMKGTLTKNGKNNLFSPTDPLTREQFVTILQRVFRGTPSYGMETYGDYETIYQYRSKFTDVDRFSWYGKTLMWVEKYCITEGVSDTEFGIGRPISREEMATLIARCLKMKKFIKEINDTNTPENFADMHNISNWAMDGVKYMRKLGIMMGDENGNFNSKATATRAEAAAIAVRLREYLAIDFDVLFSTDIVNSIKFEFRIESYDESGKHFWDTKSYTVSSPDEVAKIMQYIKDGEIKQTEMYMIYIPGCMSHLYLYDKNGNEIISMDFTPDELGFFGFKSYYFNTEYFSGLYDKMMSNPDGAK